MPRQCVEGDEWAGNGGEALPPLPWGLNWAYKGVKDRLTIYQVVKRGNAQPRDDKATFAKWEGVLTTDKHARKLTPIFSGFLRYFPRATAAVAALSQIGNEQHNPGTPLHWDRSKSGDEHDALVRHLLEAGAYDTDGVRHSVKVAWRAMAALEKELEADDCSDGRPEDAPADRGRSDSCPGSEDSGPGY